MVNAVSLCRFQSRDHPHEKQNRVKWFIHYPQNRQNIAINSTESNMNGLLTLSLPMVDTFPFHEDCKSVSHFVMALSSHRTKQTHKIPKNHVFVFLIITCSKEPIRYDFKHNKKWTSSSISLKSHSRMFDLWLNTTSHTIRLYIIIIYYVHHLVLYQKSSFISNNLH